VGGELEDKKMRGYEGSRVLDEEDLFWGVEGGGRRRGCEDGQLKVLEDEKDQKGQNEDSEREAWFI
jgi:hypothetical protein